MPFALNGLKWAVPTVQWSFADLDLQGDPFQSTVTSSALRTAVRSAFAAWDAVTELDFLEVADSASSNIRIGEGDLPWASPPGLWGEARATWDASDFFTSATVVFEVGSPDAGNLYFKVALHEIGHNLGLERV
jgi:hypothetical protein